MNGWIYSGRATRKGTSHSSNEDAMFSSTAGMLSEEGFVAVICDGVSSVPHGKWAAEQSCAMIEEFFHCAQRYTKSDFAQQINTMSLDIHNTKGKRGACTLSLCWIINQEIHAFALGDTQIALWRDETLYVLTEDRKKEGNIRYFMGMRNPIEEGLQHKTMTLWDEDIILIMSDGVSEIISQQDFAHIWLSCYEDPQLCAEKLVQFAHFSGSTDDNSVIVMHYRSDE